MGEPSTDAGGLDAALRDAGLRDACTSTPACLDAGPSLDAPQDAPACAAVRAEPGERIAPVDVIWAIQSTGTMQDEMRLVEETSSASPPRCASPSSITSSS